MITYLWVCPCCEGENLTYDKIQFEGDQCYFPRKCDDCWAKWEERYNMDFIWHENVLPNNQKENVWKDTTKQNLIREI